MFITSYSETIGKENGLNQQVNYGGGMMDSQGNFQGRGDIRGMS